MLVKHLAVYEKGQGYCLLKPQTASSPTLEVFVGRSSARDRKFRDVLRSFPRMGNFNADDMLAALKLIGLLLTGVFGIAGALFNFKEPTGRISAWGRRNLIGLAVGLVISVTTFVGEFVVKRRSDRESARKTERLLAMATTVLNPVNRIKIEFSYSVLLNHPSLTGFKRID